MPPHTRRCKTARSGFLSPHWKTFPLLPFILLCVLDVSSSHRHNEEGLHTRRQLEKPVESVGVRLLLVHRSSLRSPYGSHSNVNRLEILAEARQLDVARIQALAARLRRASSDALLDGKTTSNISDFRTGVTSGASVGAGQYFIEFALGTPPQKFMLIADTGSDLVWVRCSNCRRRCSNVGGSAGGATPTFLTRASSSYRAIPCLSQDCLLVPAPPSFSCNLRIPSTCMYDYTYTDTSESIGIFSRDTVSLNSSSSKNMTGSSVTQVPDVAFGCGLRNEGQSFVGSDGVLGLGRGPISFFSQIGALVGNKFSYCLVDFFRTPAQDSYLVLGDLPSSLKLRSPFQFTPLLENPFGQSLYYVGVEEVRVNGQALSIPSYVWDIDAAGNGGTVVDSGTTLTLFVEPAYREILNAVTEALVYPQTDPVQTFDLCFNATGITNLELPSLAISLQGNALFQPPASNIFIDIPGGLKCLGLQGVPFGFSVLGNLIQQNFEMQFDIDGSLLGFAPTLCSQALEQ